MKSRKTLKSCFSQGEFGDEFIELAKKELPYLWGRLSLLEEFYGHNAPGINDRSRMLSDQLGRPKQFHGGAFRKLWQAITG